MSVKYKRLTEKDGFNYIVKENLFDDLAINKLGQYEDIEELCEKIKTHPVYQKIYDGCNDKYIIYEDKFFDCSITYNFEKRAIEIYRYEWTDELKLEHYGTQWALTRGELEK